MQMQLNGKNRRTLASLERGECAVISRLDVPEPFARRLMELGFLPGGRVLAARSAPGGDPRVFEVDGGLIALRRETASNIQVENGS